MQIESLNCPNCGAAVMSDAAQCKFCQSRLKTMACPKCLGLMFQGSKHCPKCGALAVLAKLVAGEGIGNCPRCKVALSQLQIADIHFHQCQRCYGIWSDAKTFEDICADRENRAAVLHWAQLRPTTIAKSTPIQYIPCAVCKQLMNRNNFAHSSGVIIDICKAHGVWFDAEELPRIIEFIHAGGMDRARQKEKLQLEEDRRSLREEQYRLSQQQMKFGGDAAPWNHNSGMAVRDFVKLLFD